MTTTIVWFRQDLRLDDNPALIAAARRGGCVIPVFVWSPEEEGEWPPGAASRWWLHHSLASLATDLEQRGSRLILRTGDAIQHLLSLARDCRADAIAWNRRYEPAAVAVEESLSRELDAAGIVHHDFNSSLLFEPRGIATSQGQPYKVFTPFWNSCLAQPEPLTPQPPPRVLAPPEAFPHGVPLKQLALLPRVDWAPGLRESWTPGEAGAAIQLKSALKRAIPSYEVTRDRPDLDGTSRLSPHLHFGEISPRRVWHGVQRIITASRDADAAASGRSFLRQLGWREFAHHLLFHFPHTAQAPLRPEFAAFPWRRDEGALQAWQQGRTGYPCVDAGMRQLWATGWMHNRVRMMAASFLVKDLLIPWQDGARWFWDTLVDADLANNTLGWQWTAGCGADASPWFRIFNPVSQGEKFDPDGHYARRWVPELARVPARAIHSPWLAPREVLRQAGVELGGTYPAPMVDHASARTRALEALATLRKR